MHIEALPAWLVLGMLISSWVVLFLALALQSYSFLRLPGNPKTPAEVNLCLRHGAATTSLYALAVILAFLSDHPGLAAIGLVGTIVMLGLTHDMRRKSRTLHRDQAGQEQNPGADYTIPNRRRRSDHLTAASDSVQEQIRSGYLAAGPPPGWVPTPPQMFGGFVPVGQQTRPEKRYTKIGDAWYEPVTHPVGGATVSFRLCDSDFATYLGKAGLNEILTGDIVHVYSGNEEVAVRVPDWQVTHSVPADRLLKPSDGPR